MWRLLGVRTRSCKVSNFPKVFHKKNLEFLSEFLCLEGWRCLDLGFQARLPRRLRQTSKMSKRRKRRVDPCWSLIHIPISSDVFSKSGNHCRQCGCGRLGSPYKGKRVLQLLRLCKAISIGNAAMQCLMYVRSWDKLSGSKKNRSPSEIPHLITFCIQHWTLCISMSGTFRSEALSTRPVDQCL